jgi:hypothetical protein
MKSFVSPFREAKFCGVPSRVLDKLGCAAGEKKVAEHWFRHPPPKTGRVRPGMTLA